MRRKPHILNVNVYSHSTTPARDILPSELHIAMLRKNVRLRRGRYKVTIERMGDECRTHEERKEWIS